MKESIRLLGDRVLVRVESPSNDSDGKPLRGTVVQVGTGRNVKVGDVVLYAENTSILINGERCIILVESQILAVVIQTQDKCEKPACLEYKHGPPLVTSPLTMGGKLSARRGRP